MRGIISALALSLLLVLPARAQQAQTISLGMTLDEVVAVFGVPTFTFEDREWTYLFYSNPCSSRCTSDDVVFLRRGRVASATFRSDRRALARRLSDAAPAAPPTGQPAQEHSRPESQQVQVIPERSYRAATTLNEGSPSPPTVAKSAADTARPESKPAPARDGGAPRTQAAPAQRPITATGARKHIQAVHLIKPVTLDGVLDDVAWQGSGRTEFRRRTPRGRPSEKTEVWVAYDDRALYVAARSHDRQPSSIARTIGPRDSDVEADWFMVSIDAFRDRRTGYFFRVTPGGAIQDGTLFNDYGSNTSWDGVWERATSVDSLGWTAEIRIPFSQLRFNSSPEAIWGINFTRRIHRTNEIVDFTPPTGQRGNVSLFADLIGLKDVDPPTRLEVLPYVVAQAHVYEGQPENPFYTGRDILTDFGADLKLGIGSGMTLNAAFNPDFGHVEVDPAVVNLSANETFYQEKRPFFLEGASIFDFGNASGMRFFHSRRIGRVPQGSTSRKGFVNKPDQTEILGAAKLTGKLGSAWTIGSLNAVTAREFAEVDVSGTRFMDEIEPLSYYGVLRAQRDFNEGSKGFGLFTSAAVRDLREERLQPILNSNAIVGGVDGWSYFGSRRNTAIEGWAGFSHITGSPEQMIRQQQAHRRYYQRPDATHLRVDSTATTLTGFAGRLLFRSNVRRVSTNVTLHAVSPGFELNDLGFNNRSDVASVDASIRYHPGGTNTEFDRASVGVSASRVYDFSRTLLSTGYTLSASGQLKNFWGGSASVSYSPEGLDVLNTRGGPSMLSPAGWSASASAYSDSRKSVTLSANGDVSQDEGGNWSFSTGGELSWYPSPRLLLSLGPWWGKYFADAGYYTRKRDTTAMHTYGMRSIFAGLSQEYLSTDVRLNWTFTPGLSLQLYAQPYFTNIRYGDFKELARPGTYDFLVYGRGGSTIVEEGGAYIVDPDGEGPAGPITLYNSDFDYSSLRGTAVLRWEYRSGSSLIFAWTHDRYAYEDYWQDWQGSLLESYPDNRFMVKLTYWLSP